MIAARGHRFSVIAHAIDGDGAVCGTRPSGRWIPTTRLPVNCPACLLRLDKPRYATCETPTASSASYQHIRKVGSEGLCFSGNPGAANTLCGLVVGWDLAEIREPLRSLTSRRDICPTCTRIGIAPYSPKR